MQTTDLIVALRALLAEFRSPENGHWLTSACADRLEAALTEHAPQETEPGPSAAGARLRAPPVEGAPLDGYCAICYHPLDACRHCDGIAVPVDGHPLRVIATDTITGVQQERLVSALVVETLRCWRCGGSDMVYCVCGMVSAANGFSLPTQVQIEEWWAQQPPDIQQTRGGLRSAPVVTQEGEL